VTIDWLALDGLAPASAADMASVLDRYGRETRQAVSRYLTVDPPAPYLDDLLGDYPSRGGKMMRPAICIANARVFGGRLEDAILCAAAVEILHNGLLIHDDIQDDSELRRGRPTLHALHGVPLAINAGDAMMFSALRPLIDSLRPLSPNVVDRVLKVSLTMARETAEGQALELGWRDLNETTLGDADYLRLVVKKTAWMGMIWPAQLGMLIGSRGGADPDSLVRFGCFLGAAFQIEDDLRNLAATESYGKEKNGDLFEAKRTLMLIHVRGACSEAERARLDAFLALDRRQRSLEDVLWLAELMEQRGSIDHARLVAGALAGAAAHEFALVYGALPPSSDLSFIAGLIPWVFDRP
jgi:geranylgeranyl diphosphate synthase, type II